MRSDPTPAAARIAAHIPCLERAAADPAAPAAARARIAALVQLARTATALTLPAPDGYGTPRNDAEQLGAEAADA